MGGHEPRKPRAHVNRPHELRSEVKNGHQTALRMRSPKLSAVIQAVDVIKPDDVDDR
jgi:hypothetical protein